MSYTPGERVRVSRRTHDGHHRTPGYVKGKIGTIERALGSFGDPETRAYGGDGLPARPLYSVTFAQRDLWPDYGGESGDRLQADLYEHWLEWAR